MLAKPTTDKQRYWLKHVKAADLSDGTLTEYAAINTISLKSLYQWKTKLIRLKLYQPGSVCPESNFVSVSPSKAESTESIVETAPKEQPGCTVTLSNGTRIEFHGELSVTMIQSIMTSVSQAH